MVDLGLEGIAELVRVQDLALERAGVKLAELLIR
jgi:hypothetical protein